MSNLAHAIIFPGLATVARDGNNRPLPIQVDFSTYQNMLLAGPTGETAFMEAMNALLLGGNMSDALRFSIRAAWEALPITYASTAAGQRDKVRLAVYIIAASPEFAVQK
jgi:hypothetical protein